MARIEQHLRRDALRRLEWRRLLEGWMGLEGVTQEDLARRLGVSQTHLSQVMAGLKRSAPLLAAIELETGVPAARAHQL